MATTLEQRRINNKNFRDRWFTNVHAAPFHLEERIEIPATVLAERDRRRYLAPANLTAGLMGDPLPGGSALDRK